ncbi:MAG: MotA/TolQ/ExbB proton channel family protein, partial [Gammaproteobacteria bacterium]
AGYLLDRVGVDGQRLSVTATGGELAVAYGDARLASSAPLIAGQWHHIAVAAGGDTLSLYLDGVEVASAAVPLGELDGMMSLGGGTDGSGNLAVALDEVVVSSVVRSADRMALNATLQGLRNDQAMTYGADESAEAATEGAEGGHSVGHFAIIFQHVFGNDDALIEQLVIGVCGLMMMISVLVMVMKGISLTRARGATARFLKAYENLAPTIDDPNAGFTSLYDRTRTFRDSPLFRVYRRGLDEVRSRFSPAVGAAPAGLDEKAMMSLRAGLDAVMVREGQKLNSQLVLLTIAISGGPFIGLLGTVVGVMVTFAAIAATGDVNIAAIAPGMAAALLATVAGLGVAIPALFGYNYLGSQVKELSADMHVFADEFMARVNEYYGH